jgi:hypothetical protein
MSAEWPSDPAGTAAADVAVEASARASADSALAASDALKLVKAENLKDVSSAATSRTNLGLGSAATHASTDFDAAGTAATAQANAEAVAIPLTQKAAPSGVASLDGAGLLPTSQLPPLALTDPYVVVSEAAQLALSAHKGDFAIRTDIGKTFVQNGGKAGTMADWTEIVTPGDVTSVNGHTGTVSLTHADVGADATGAAASAQSAAEAASIPESQLDAVSGAAKLGTDKTVGGPGGSALSASVESGSCAAPSGSDDTAMLNGALRHGQLKIKGGIYHLSGRVVLLSGQDLWGEGQSISSSAVPATEFLCTTVEAGITIEGTGGVTGNFTVNGNGIATEPFIRLGGAERTLETLSVVKSAQDNWVITTSQNDLYIGCNSSLAARDNIIMDSGAGGSKFERFESYGAGRFELRSDNLIAHTDYSIPTHITFDHCIFENGEGEHRVQLNAGTRIVLRECILSAGGTTLTGAVLNLNGAGTVVFDGGEIFGSSQSTAIRIVSGTNLIIEGEPVIQAHANGIEALSGATIQLLGRIAWSTTTNHWVGTGGENTVLRMRLEQAIEVTRAAAGNSVLLARLAADAGLRFEINDEGSLRWNYGGVGFTLATHLSVRSDASLEANVPFFAAAFSAGAGISGHPTTGKYKKGMFVVDEKSVLWVCAAEGEPGTWESFKGEKGAPGPASGRLAIARRKLITENFNLAFTQSSVSPASETLYGFPVELYEGEEVTNLLVVVATAGVGTPPTWFELGLANPANIMVATTGNIHTSSLLTTLSEPTAVCPLTSKYVVTVSGAYTLCLVSVGSWATTQMLLGRTATPVAGRIGAPLGTANIGAFGVFGNNKKELPAVGAEIKPGTGTGIVFWVGAS